MLIPSLLLPSCLQCLIEWIQSEFPSSYRPDKWFWMQDKWKKWITVIHFSYFYHSLFIEILEDFLQMVVYIFMYKRKIECWIQNEDLFWTFTLLYLYYFCSQVKDTEFLPILRYVQTNGNVLVYEWTHGCKPSSAVNTSVVIDTKDEEDVAESADVR